MYSRRINTRDDDDDRFLYGDANDVEEAPKPTFTTSGQFAILHVATAYALYDLLLIVYCGCCSAPAVSHPNHLKFVARV